MAGDPQKLAIWLRHVHAGTGYALLLYSNHPEWSRTVFDKLKRLEEDAELLEQLTTQAANRKEEP